MEKFLRFYSRVSQFAVDLSPEEQALLDSEGPYHLSRLLDVDLFYRDIYQRRPLEESKIKAALETSHILCVIGPRGSGKTSLIRRVLLDLQESKRGDRLIIDLDLRQLVGHREYLEARPLIRQEPEHFSLFLRKRIIERYLTDYFAPGTNLKDGRNAECALYEYVLTQNTPTFSNFINVQKRANRLLQKHRKPKDTSRDSCYKWLVKTNSDAPTEEIINEIEALIDLRHLVHAVRVLYGFRSQTLWYDNADALAGEEQAHIFNYLRQTHADLGGYATSIMTIRAENIKTYEVTNEPDAPANVDFYILRGNAGRRDLPAIEIPALEPRLIRSIINQRLLVARKVQSDFLFFLNAELPNASAGESKAEILQALNHFGPAIADSDFQVLSQLSWKLFGRMIDERAIYLCNSSLRRFLSLHAETLGKYVQVYRLQGSKAITAEDWYLSTLFLRWLRRAAREFSVGVYDIVESVQRWNETGRTGTGCVLPHLVATCLWNLQSDNNIGGRPYRCPTVGQVVQKIERLGYDRDTIVRAIHSLYLQDSSFPNLIDFKFIGIISSPEEIKDNLELFLTERGKALTGWTCNTFGYLFESVHVHKDIVPKRDEAGRALEVVPTEVPSHDALEELLPFLCDLAYMYSCGLRRIRSLFGGDNWLQTYCLQFGIPSRDRSIFTRRGIGQQHGGVRRPLHFEAIMGHLHAYLRKHGSKKDQEKIRQLERLFHEEVQKVDKGDKFPTQFREALGLKPRYQEPRNG